MNHLFQTLRSLKARKTLFIITIIGLAICLSSAIFLFLYVNFIKSYDSFHDGELVYRVESRLYDGNTLTDNWATSTYGHGPALKKEIPGIENFARITAQDKEQTVTYEDRQFIEDRYCYAESSFFELFNFPIIEGEKKNQLKRPNTLLISQTAAQRYFGNNSPLGKTLLFRTASSIQSFEVTGVFADIPTNSHIQFDFLLSYTTIPPERQDIWYIHGVYTYIKIEPGTKPSEIEKAFQLISDKYKTNALKHKDWKIELIPLKDIYLMPQKGYEKEKKGNRTAILILTIMAIALVVIGWVNTLNLTVARFLERGKEFGIRKVFGATRLETIFQGLFESALINMTALLLALGLLEVLLPIANTIDRKSVV